MVYRCACVVSRSRPSSTTRSLLTFSRDMQANYSDMLEGQLHIFALSHIHGSSGHRLHYRQVLPHTSPPILCDRNQTQRTMAVYGSWISSHVDVRVLLAEQNAGIDPERAALPDRWESRSWSPLPVDIKVLLVCAPAHHTLCQSLTLSTVLRLVSIVDAQGRSAVPMNPVFHAGNPVGIAYDCQRQVPLIL